jgi:tellurite methyltransferase
MNTISELNKDHWEHYYEQRNTNQVWVTIPSQFAAFCAANVQNKGNLLELGCGNGRDSVFFAEYFNEVISIDYADHAIEIVNDRATKSDLKLKGEVLNIYDEEMIQSFYEKHTDKFDILYARFFLHAVKEYGENNFWKIADRVLKTDGLIYVEYRNCFDERKDLGEKISEYERSDGHYRRFLIDEDVIKRASDAGFTVEYSISGKGLAKFRNEDPNVSRLILKRN